MPEHADNDVTSIVDRLNRIQAEYEAAERADEPAITFGMDDDRITFRDQAALDEYVHGALDDCDTEALRRNAKHNQIVRAAKAQAWDEGARQQWAARSRRVEFNPYDIRPTPPPEASQP